MSESEDTHMEEKDVKKLQTQNAGSKPESSKENTPATESGELSREWATEALEELDDFIESQGIYIRQ
ncbi:MAG: hypothetical protein PUG70_02235 [Lachnospiraceae bacterium]|nr:hypothetical protein [Lachnospiraceae bacterium]